MADYFGRYFDLDRTVAGAAEEVDCILESEACPSGSTGEVLRDEDAGLVFAGRFVDGMAGSARPFGTDIEA